MKRLLCRDCGRNLRNGEAALNLKLRGRGIGTFYCGDCLAERMDSTAGELRRLEQYFRENGCELFSVHYVDEE